MANFADPDVAYVCGRLALERADGSNREGVYWRFELWQRASESAMGSITAGNGGIYAVRRADYIETAAHIGHDLGLPYRMAQRGRRAVYDPQAVAWEKPARDAEDEYARKVRMHAQIWRHVLSGDMLRGGGPLYLLEIVSHRVLRYAQRHPAHRAAHLLGRARRRRAWSTRSCSARSWRGCCWRAPGGCGCPCPARRWPTTTCW